MGVKTILKPEPDSFVQHIQKLKSFLPLAFTLAKRDLRVKYSQTLLGISWTIIQPVATLFIFTFFFGYILNWKSGDIPFSLYVFSGLLPWNFFTYIVFQGSGSVLEASTLIKKIYFPKLILPISKIIVAITELAISLILLIILIIYYNITPSWHLILLPIVIVLGIIPAITLVVWAAALSYRLRDLLHTIPFLMYFGIWITPVFFTKNILPHNLQFLWAINPMTGIIELWRWCLFENWTFNPIYIWSFITLIPLLLIGLIIYSRNESKFSDFV